VRATWRAGGVADSRAGRGRHGAAVRVVALVLALLLGLRGPGPTGGPPMLQVEAAAGLVWRGEIREGEAFDLAFTHSAEGCRWTHHYRVHGRAIEQMASTFACFGAGMPTWTPAVRTPAGYTVPAPLRLSEIAMMNASAAAIALDHRRRTVPIGAWLADWERFRVSVAR
jgi:hypothetical protein